MKTVAYCSPFVPAEWIAAHGMIPSWLKVVGRISNPSPPGGGLPIRPTTRSPQRAVAAGRGVCAYAGAVLDTVLSGLDAAAVVMTTACDQMRYAAAILERDGPIPVFLMNVPKTWETAVARGLYRDELRRLGRFLVQLGGKEPSPEELSAVMLRYDGARAAACVASGGLSRKRLCRSARHPSPATRHIPLALIGGPLPEGDELLDIVERSGGRVVLDATEGGQRTLPGRFDPERTRRDPVEELVDAYFGAIPDVFRRPNDRMHQWLSEQIAACKVRGILFRRYLGCDLWHAELYRIRQWSPVPVLDFDAVGDDDAATSRTVGRLEAFLEMLQ